MLKIKQRYIPKRKKRTQEKNTTSCRRNGEIETNASKICKQLLLARGHAPFFLSFSLSLSLLFHDSLRDCISLCIFGGFSQIIRKLFLKYTLCLMKSLQKSPNIFFGSPWRSGFLVWRPCFNMCDMADMSYDLDCATGNHPSNFHAVLSFGPKNCHCRCSELEVSQLWANNGFILCR